MERLQSRAIAWLLLLLTLTHARSFSSSVSFRRCLLRTKPRGYTSVTRLRGSADGAEPTQRDFDALRRMFMGSSILPFFSNHAPYRGYEINSEQSYITVPLQWNGEAYLVYYRVDGALFRAVLDTGSPFLMIPGSCGENTRSKTGCYRQQGRPSGLADTFEQFDGFEGNVEWRTAHFTFVNATGSMLGPREFTFGVASESLLSGRGGVFLGLVRDTDAWIRPSFLGQTPVRSFRISMAVTSPTLTLATAPLIVGGQRFLKMNSDLRRKFGSPTDHYAVLAESVLTNGYSIGDDGRPIYVIFDTGVTGMIVSRDLFDERYTTARKRKERNLWGNVTISFASSTFSSPQSDIVSLSAKSPLTTPFDPKQAWKRFRGHLVVVGLSFLVGKSLIVDIDSRKLCVEDS